MDTSGIPLNVSTESFGSSAFQVNQGLGTPIEQSQPVPADGPLARTDSVTISSQALKLSKQPHNQDSK